MRPPSEQPPSAPPARHSTFAVRRNLFIAALAVLGAPVYAQESAVILDGLKSVSVRTATAAAVSVDLGRLASAVQLKHADVIASGVSGGAARVLFEVCGPSRPATVRPSSYCAGGSECNLIWLEVAGSGKVGRIESHLIVSCRESRDGSAQDCTRDPEVVRCQFLDARAREEIVLSFPLSGSPFAARVVRRKLVD